VIFTSKLERWAGGFFTPYPHLSVYGLSIYFLSDLSDFKKSS
jgi:hypothetical protein